MQTNRSTSKNRPLPAILAAVGITMLIGLGLLVLAANALLNPGVALIQSPVDAKAAGISQDQGAADANSPALAQLQQQIAQYQSREQEYQQREQQLTQQLQQALQQRDQAQNQAMQFQQVLDALQQAGVIQIGRDGRIFLTQPGFVRSDRDHD